MDFQHSAKTQKMIDKLTAFMEAEIYPNEAAVGEWNENPANLWVPWPGLSDLKKKAKEAGLWNLFLPLDYGDFSPGLTNMEYAPLAEIMGRVRWSAEVFNCDAPDTGNMEVLAKFGTPEQQKRWLTPLMEGDIRSAYLMTEPAVASSDATNLETSIVRDGDEYVINGTKWWITGIRDPRCELLIIMGKTDVTAERHKQHSTILVPRHTPGVTIERSLPAFGRMNSPGGESVVQLNNVRVPKENLVLGEGRGFEIAQGRLGPGRIHHAMRSIGQAQRALELMAVRANSRVAFGKKLADHGSVRQDIAKSWYEVEMARLLTLKAADAMDRVGVQGARDLIAAIKVVAPHTALRVTDRAIQVHGGMGVSDDTVISEFWTFNRCVRLGDGPDEVHLAQLGRIKLNEYCGN